MCIYKYNINIIINTNWFDATDAVCTGELVVIPNI